MIIILSWPVILLLVGIWAAFSAIGAILFGIQNSWDDEKVQWLKPFTLKQKWGLFALLLAIFSGVGAFLYGWFYHIPWAGVFGFFTAIVASVAAAYLCSPLKWDWQSASHPLGVLASIASLVVIVAFAWIFILIAIFRKSTWRLYVGIVAALALFIACAAGGLVIYQNVERSNTLKAAESYIASDEYEKAMGIYQDLGEETLYLQTKYRYGMWQLEQKEYYRAREIFTELSEIGYSDSAEQVLRTNYLWGRASEEEGSYGSAANIYALIPGYEDATERRQNACYIMGCEEATSLSGWEKAVEWFQAAGDYKDAPQLAIYYQARILGQENLPEAESLLLQLPRDFLDVDIMLTAIETYRDWNGIYTLKNASGEKPEDYTRIELVLVYHRLSFPADAHVKWKVLLYEGSRSTTFYSDGELPEKGVLKFETGSEYQKNFQITQNRINLVQLDPYGSYTDKKRETRYTFEREG